MAPQGGHRRRTAVALVGLALLIAGLFPLVPVRAQEDDELAAALAALDGARADVVALSAALDRVVADFERVDAHHERLTAELGAAERVAEAAKQRIRQAEAQFATQVSEAYKHPGAEIGLAEAVLAAGDPGTAMHRAALVGRLSLRSVGQIRLAQSDRAGIEAANQQHRIIAAGAATSAAERRRAAEALTLALGTAQHRLERAEQQAEVAKQRVAARARARTLVVVGTAPLPVDGRVCPVGGPNGFSDSWGAPRSEGRRHQGVDVFAPYGTPLYAVADGVVRRVWSNRLGGLSIDLLDTDGHRYYYAHLSSAAVEPGQTVAVGTVIGAVGDSGNARSTPPHLHWQFHPGDGPPVNPFPLTRALCRPTT